MEKTHLLCNECCSIHIDNKDDDVFKYSNIYAEIDLIAAHWMIPVDMSNMLINISFIMKRKTYV